MSTECLLVIENDSPLNFAFEMLLTPDKGVKATKSSAGDLQILVDEICETKPQVVIFEDTAKLTENHTLFDLLMSTPKVTIVIVQRESNYIHVFRKEEIMIESSSDFLEALRLE